MRNNKVTQQATVTTTTSKVVFAALANTSAAIANNTSKRYTVAGVSTLPSGETKVRLANNLRERTNILRRNGHTDIMLLQLDTAMTELEATVYLLNVDFGREDLNAVVVKHAADLGHKVVADKTE